MKQYIKVFVILMVLPVLLRAETMEETIKKSIPISPGGTVILKNMNGSVKIEGWDGKEVVIEATKIVTGTSRSRVATYFKKTIIEIQPGENEVIIRTLMPRRHFSFWKMLFGGITNISVRYRLKIPRSVTTKIKTTNGSITARSVNGNLMLKTTNGKIEVEECAGLVKAKTTNGSIRIELTRIVPDGEYEMETTNGSIKVWLPENSQFELHAQTTNGSIYTDFPVKVKGRHTYNSLNGIVGKGGTVFLLETTNGSISLRVR